MNPRTLARLKDTLVFHVTDEETGAGQYDALGLPCFQSNSHAGRICYQWTLSSLGPNYDFAIGHEMGLAYLRAHLYSVAPDPDPYSLSCAFWPDFSMVMAAVFQGANEDQRDGFSAAVSAFLEFAMSAPPLVLRNLVARLFALNNAGLRERCLVILNDRPVPDPFNPEGLGFEQ